jgi:hypothetical protein
MQANMNNPGAIQARAQELGLNNSDLLQAAQTVNPNLTLGNVNQYMGGAAPAMARGAQMGGAQLQGYEKNPYLDQMAAGITQQATRNLNEQVLPGVRSQAVASGGFGGSRQGIAEGLAMGRTSDAITNSLSNLYGTDYNNQMNRNMQKYGIDQQTGLGYGQLDATNRGIDNQYALGLQNAGNQRYATDQSFNLGMTNADNQRYSTDKSYEVGMAGANASMANAAASQANAAGNLALGQQQLGLQGTFGLLDRQYQYGQGAQQAAGAVQNTPYNYWNQFSQGANSIGQGYGSSTQSGGGSDPLLGAAGLAQVGSSWYNSRPSANSAGGSNSTGFGTGSGFGNQDLGTYF